MLDAVSLTLWSLVHVRKGIAQSYGSDATQSDKVSGTIDGKKLCGLTLALESEQAF